VKIAVCGTHCSGKSTLVDYISKTLEVPIIKEVAGRFTEKERQNLATQLDILQSQMNEEISREDFISDRSVIDNCAYIRFHSHRNNIPSVYKETKKFVNNYLTTQPYDLIIFVDEYFPLVNNGIRNLDENQQKIVFEYLKKHITAVAARYNIPLLVIRGSTRKRYELVKEWLTSQTQQ
jgi:nicotinamide riboside kinase